MNKLRMIAATVMAIAMGSGPVIADTLRVPDDFPTVQEAIDASVSGDVIEVSPGIYPITESLDTLGKEIEIRGTLAEDGSPLTLIDGQGETRLLVMNNGETSNTLLRNLEFRNGALTGFGSLLRVTDGSPVFEDCHFRNGESFYKGGASLVDGSSAVVFRRCLFESNTCFGGGGAVFVDDLSQVTFEDSLVRDNVAGAGGGLYVNGMASLSLQNTWVCSNFEDQIDGGFTDLGGNTISDSCDCPTGDLDSDADGTLDCDDGCPNDPEKTAPGACGCGIADTDSDADGTPDCLDGCPEDPDKTEPGECGCGLPETDSDGDGAPDCIDALFEVPSNFPTISDAIAAAFDGVTIQVAPGIYNESIDFEGKGITIIGDPDDPSSTTIDGLGIIGSIVMATSGEDATSILSGLRISGGVIGSPISEAPDAVRAGGALFIADSSPLIENCLFTQNQSIHGGAVYCTGSGALFRECVFEGNFAGRGAGLALVDCPNVVIRASMIRLNTATSDGGGIMASNGTPRIIECVIEENLAAQLGGGIAWTSNDEATPLLIDATQVVSNTSLKSGGGLSSAGAPASVGNSVFCDNDPDQIVGEFTDLGGNEICTETCPGDFNGDGTVGGSDLGVFFTFWGDCDAPCEADFNGDGEVDGPDLGVFFSFWGLCP